jgi:hypothetical protein
LPDFPSLCAASAAPITIFPDGSTVAASQKASAPENLYCPVQGLSGLQSVYTDMQPVGYAEQMNARLLFAGNMKGPELHGINP